MKFAFVVAGSIFLQSYWVSDNVYPLHLVVPILSSAERQVFDLDVVYMYQKKMRSPLSDSQTPSTVAAVLKPDLL